MERTTSETVHAAAVNLHNAGRKISRQVLAEVTGLKLEIIDDHVGRLIGNGRLRRVVQGVVELVEVFPANRPISKTVLGNGLVKLEVGDNLLELYPSEAHVVGQMLQGEAMQFAAIRGERDVADTVARLAKDLRESQAKAAAMAKQVEKMTNHIAKLQRQSQLFETA